MEPVLGNNSAAICSVVRSRSFQGTVTRPPKPPVGLLIWNVFDTSGAERNALLISSAKSVTWSRVAFAGALTIPKINP